MEPITSLMLANAGFVGSHFLMSHPMRPAMTRLLGEQAFLGVYSLVSIGFFAWIVLAFRAASAGDLLWGAGSDAAWIIASVLTIVAVALLLGSLRGNPALPATTAFAVTAAQPSGVYAVTRHPMLWSFALWAIAHIIAWPSVRTVVTAGAMGVLALLGAYLQDRKKVRLLGEAWQGWQAKTSYWPRIGALVQISWMVWIVAIAVWLGFCWLHVWLAGMPAGVWRWMS